MSVQFPGHAAHGQTAFPADPSFRVSVTAGNEPGALSRLLEPIAKRGMTASRILAEHVGGELRVLLELDDMDEGMVERIAREMSGSWLVRQVEVARVESRVRVVGASSTLPCPWCGF